MINILGMDFWLGAAVGVALLVVYLFLRHKSILQLQASGKEMLKQVQDEAAHERHRLLERARDEARHRRNEAELELKQKRIESQKLEHSMQKRTGALKNQEAELEAKQSAFSQAKGALEEREFELSLKEEKVRNSFESLVQKLEKISHMSAQEAKDILLKSLKNEVELENNQWIAKAEEEARLKAKENSMNILCSTMQRYLADQVTANSSGVVPLPSEDMKGRIIGKEGRNIKALEMATGMEFVIGDPSETITISGFHPIRREIAKRTLEALLQDGRINPTRIEEVAAKCEEEINDTIEEMGQQVVVDLSLSGVHREIVKLLGRLHFRTSYSQNVLEHSKETAYFARMIAEELGLDGRLAARCGLLHDIGKAVSHEVEGPHAVVGAELAKSYGENDIVVGAIESHHEDVQPTSIYGIIVMIADAISASRTGARKETLSAYVKRLEQLEEIANSFDGVKKAFALQAGREVRIVVDEVKVDDSTSINLARKVARRVEQEMNFPGQIKVNVIREKRAVEYAK